MSAMRRQVREIVLRGGKEEEELLEALGLHSKFLGQYVALREFNVVDHDANLYRLAERIFADTKAQDEVIITNVGKPKRMITIEV